MLHLAVSKQKINRLPRWINTGAAFNPLHWPSCHGRIHSLSSACTTLFGEDGSATTKLHFDFALSSKVSFFSLTIFRSSSFCSSSSYGYASNPSLPSEESHEASTIPVREQEQEQEQEEQSCSMRRINSSTEGDMHLKKIWSCLTFSA